MLLMYTVYNAISFVQRVYITKLTDASDQTSSILFTWESHTAVCIPLECCRQLLLGISEPGFPSHKNRSIILCHHTHSMIPG